MNAEFSSAIGQWQSFQALAGAAAATLLGLIFVSASIRPELFARNAHPELSSDGGKSMGLLMLVTLIALVFLIPDIRPTSMGTSLAIMAAIALFNTGQQLRIVRHLLRDWGPFFVARRFALPAAGHLSLLGVSVLLYSGDTEWLPLLAFTQILFIFTATYNAWDLLTRIGESHGSK